MSVILDALKRLDREKSARRAGTPNIAAEILRPDLPRPGKRIPFYFTMVFLTAIAAAAITYAVMMKFGVLSKSSLPMPKSPPEPSQQVATGPLIKETFPEARDEKSEAVVKTPSHDENKNNLISTGKEREDQKMILEEKRAPAEEIKITTEPPPKISTSAPPQLKLSAIVWYEEPSKRFAMINGKISYEGAMIEGVKILEIYPNRVRFQQNNHHFEIFLFK